MSECEHMRSLFSSKIDGELSTRESQEIDRHLISCDGCRSEWETLAEIDIRLTSFLAINDLDSKCAAILAQASAANQVANTRKHSWNYVALSVAVAATALLAMLPFFFEKEAAQTAVPDLNLVAQLTRATGPVQLLSVGDTDWTELIPDAKKSFAAGSRLKTKAGVLCEVETLSKGVLRLNESAEVVFIEPNRVELIAGQLWCLTPESTSIEVVIPESNEQVPSPLIFGCPSSTELQCAATDRSASCDSISQTNSTATMTMGAITCSVAPGETVSIDQQQKVDRKQSVDASAKIWQLPLLAIGAEVDEELVLLLDRVLAPIGMSKARSLNEEQLRMLGPAGAIPLLAYVAAENSADHVHLRRTAIRLASELVDGRGVRLLKRLTSDPDETISKVAKEALARVETNSP